MTQIVSKSTSSCGAGDRGRTGTDFTPRDFKSLASANSATPADAASGDGYIIYYFAEKSSLFMSPRLDILWIFGL